MAIGACSFDLTDVQDTFYETISLESVVASGAVLDADTVCWWLKQADTPRLEIANATGDLITTLTSFKEWMHNIEETHTIEGVWGNGAAFDNAILAEVYHRVGIEPPWPFWLDRCYRTVKSLTDIPFERVGDHHNAADDAVSQAKHLINIMKPIS